MLYKKNNPGSKVHGANMGTIWGRQDPGEPHGGPMKFAILEVILRHTAITEDFFGYVDTFVSKYYKYFCSWLSKH